MKNNNISKISTILSDFTFKNVNYNVVCKNLPNAFCSMYIEYNDKKMIVINENLSLAEHCFYILASSYFSIDYKGPQKITSEPSTQIEKEAIEYAKYYTSKLCDNIS